MTLEEMLNSLEKAASEQAKPDEHADKPQVSKELDALLTKEAAADNAKRALEDGEKLAHAVLEKLATETIAAIAATESAAAKSEEVTKQPAVEKTAEAKPEVKTETKTEDKDMNKEAHASAKELAAAILEKLAASQAPMVENTGTPGGHKLHQDVAKDVAQDDAKVGPMPGRNGTINQLFDAIVAKAKATSGATTYDQVEGRTTSSQAENGDKKTAGTPSVGPSPDISDHAKVAEEKQAAVQYLIEAGCDWEQAVDLVKQAAEDIEREEVDQVKVAAVNEMMKEGMDFDSAVDSVRQAIEDLSKEAQAE